MIALSYIFDILALLGGVYFYVNRRKDLFCVAVYLTISSFAGLVPVNGIAVTDWAMLVCFSAFAADLVKCKKIDGLKNDFLGHSILFVVVLIIIRSIYSLFSGEETLSHIALTARVPLFWMTYFVFKKISLEDLERSWEKIYVLIVVASALTVLQMFGLDFGNYHARAFGARLREPWLLDVLFFWILMTKKINLSLKTLYVVFVLVISVLGSRFHSVLIVLMGAYVIIMPKIKLNKKISVVVVALLLIVSSAVMYKTGSLDNVGRFGQIQNDISGISVVAQRNAVKGKYLESGESATMLFRLVLAKERCQYLLDNPQYILFGIGPIYDDPRNPYNRFNFYLGTVRSDLQGIHQIESVDISYVTHLFRYGLVGIVAYAFLICCLYLRLSHYKGHSIVIRSSYLTMVLFLLQSLGANNFDRFQSMFFILLTVGTCYNMGKHELLRNSNS